MGENRPIIIALAFLYDMARSAEDEPYPPTLELRAVLGLLHTMSGADRRCYDSFWKAATETKLPAASERIGKICRTNDLLACWHEILHTFGLDASIEVMAAVYRADLTGKPQKVPRRDGKL